MTTQHLASFVANIPASEIPDVVIAAARDALIDTLACGLAGAANPASRIADQWLEANGGAPQATVWATSVAAPAADAAFANAIRSHVLDFDDSSLNLRGHPSAVMMSTALAVGEAAHASGREVLAAYALGLEVASKLSPALGPGHYFKGWHTTATAGIFAAAAIAARLWRLEAGALRHAFGLAASQAGGLTCNFGSMTKAYHVGHAAKCGITSAWLAMRGFTANNSIFDGKQSFITAYAGEGSKPLEQLVAALGKPWELEKPGLYRKRWPCCYAVHRPVAGLLELLQETNIPASEISSIEVGYLPGVQHPLIHHAPQTGLEAKFSTEYCIAAAALDRRITIDSFDDAAVQRTAIGNLMPRVKSFVIADDKVYNGLTGYNDIVVRTSAGSFSKRIDRTPGSPDWPLADGELHDKFMSCARKALPEESARRALEFARNAPQLEDIRRLTQTLAGE